MRLRAPSLLNNKLPCGSNTITASALLSSNPINWLLNTLRFTASVTSWAVPTKPVISFREPRVGCVEILSQNTSPSGFHNLNSMPNAEPVSRERCHASSASARSDGCAFTHGATPGVKPAPPSASARNVSFAVSNRPSMSVVNTPIGREAADWSMTPS